MPIQLKLREIRRSKGWSQQDVAERFAEHGAHATAVSIGRYEIGSRHVDLETAAVFAAIYGVTIDQIAGLSPL